MKKHILNFTLIISISFSLSAQQNPLSSSLFIQQDKETETYQCIQIRRGDIITLTGSIEFIDGETGSDQNNLLFTSLGGRTFLLKGEILWELTVYYIKILETKNITITGKVLFEGREDLPAKMEVTSFNPDPYATIKN